METAVQLSGDYKGISLSTYLESNGLGVYDRLIDPSLEERDLIISLINGKNLLVVGNSNNHTYGSIGTTFVAYINRESLIRKSQIGGIILGSIKPYRIGNNILTSDLNIIISDTISIKAHIKSIKYKIRDLIKEIELHEDEIDFLEETGLPYIEDISQFETWRTLNSKSLTSIEVAKRMIELSRGKFKAK